MANKKVSQLGQLTGPAGDDKLYIIDTSDTTGGAAGTSKYIEVGDLIAETADNFSTKTVADDNTTLGIGNYLFDSSGGAFTLLLPEQIGTWEFSDSNFSTDTNAVSVGTSSQSFSDETGTMTAGPFVINSGGAHVKITNVDGTSNFHVVHAPDISNPLSEEAMQTIADANFGYEFTGGFAGKPLSNNYVWDANNTIQLTADTWTPFEFDATVQAVVDTPYWSDPAPIGGGAHEGVGVFEGVHKPTGASNFYDYTYTWSDGHVGRIDVSGAEPGSLLRVRFDFNVIPTVSNTHVEAALDWNTRDALDNITFQFYLTSTPTFYGASSAGQTFLVRAELSAYFASNEDVNALIRPVIKCSELCDIQPLSLLTILQK